MIETDIAIIGGGLAGSTTAAMLGRAGIKTAMVDPHEIYPPDFRCEKIAGAHVDALRRTGLADDVLPATTFDRTVSDGTTWIARFGRLVDRRPGDQYGVMYDDLVNNMRRTIPAHVSVFWSKAVGISTSNDRQHITLANGEIISARLIVLANGLNIGLRHSLGIARKVIAPCHSITIGFNIKPVQGHSFAFGSLTHYTEKLSSRMAYLTLFPIGEAMRANLFMYRDMDDPWLRDIRQKPIECLHALMPNLRRLTGDFEVEGPMRIRPADLYVTEGHLQPGIVLVGDAFATSCPAAGNGTYKVFTDVERLCNVHIPQWLATPGMEAGKVAAFYADPVKKACDAFAIAEATKLRRMSTDSGLVWAFHRWSRFVARSAAGLMRRLRETPRVTQRTAS